jgi:hypothetical protein
MKRLTVLATVAVMLLVLVPPVAADDSTLITGLAGPLGLSVGKDGTVYVTEAFGPGRLIALDKHGNTDVLVAEPGTELAGVDAAGRGRVVYTQTVYDDDDFPVVGILARVTASGNTSEVASTLAFEETVNPDAVNTYGLIGSTNDACLEEVAEIGFPPVYTGIVESHPYAVAIDGPGYVVADAAGNTILEVSDSGRVETLAVLPSVPQVISAQTAAENGVPSCAGETFFGEPVPTDVEVRGGYVYVSLLPGFPENPGAGQVWMINRKTGASTLIADGLVTPVDIAVGADGTIYVAELFASQISTISNGVVSPYMSLDTPGAIEIDRDGTLYATTGVFGIGSVVKLTS